MNVLTSGENNSGFSYMYNGAQYSNERQTPQFNSTTNTNFGNNHYPTYPNSANSNFPTLQNHYSTQPNAYDAMGFYDSNYHNNSNFNNSSNMPTPPVPSYQNQRYYGGSFVKSGYNNNLNNSFQATSKSSALINNSSLIQLTNPGPKNGPDGVPEYTINDPVFKALNDEVVKRLVPNTAGFGFNNDKSSMGKVKLSRQEKTQKFRHLRATHVCEPCGGKFLTPQLYQAHLKTDKHAQRLEAYQSALNAIAEGSILKVESNGLNLQMYCEPCKLHLNSVIQYEVHVKGSKHIKMVKNAELVKEGKTLNDQQTKVNPQPEDGRVLEQNSNLQNAIVNQNIYKQMQPVMEKAGESQIGLEQNLSFITSKKNFADSNQTPFYCNSCCLPLNSATQYEQHIGSRKHINRAKMFQGISQQMSEESNNEPIIEENTMLNMVSVEGQSAM